VGDLARKFGDPFGMGPEAELTGLLHDLGKYAERFQLRLRDPAIRHINHWAAGTFEAASSKLWAPAFSICGHHAGMPGLKTGAEPESLHSVIERFKSPEQRTELTGRCPEDVKELLQLFEADGLVIPKVTPQPITDKFAESLRTRMLFSCLVDADFLDTAAHFQPSQVADRNVPELQESEALRLVLETLKGKPKSGPVNALRQRLLDDCLTSAQQRPGLFTLTAPTGSGKTLASLAFALKHILTHNERLPQSDPARLRRIIVVIPFTSIIEQTAAVYREVFEALFGPDYVLEHHSVVAPRERNEDGGKDAEEERLRRARLAAENWASPIVVTTNVRFFESLFSNRPSDCRRLHNISRSVVLFDEVQTLPTGLVPSLLSAVRLLVRDYGSTAVFMTATQPAFASAKSALPYGWEPVEISSNPQAMADAFKRTSIELPKPEETMSWSDLASSLATEPQSLCVVNTTKDARELFRLVQALRPGEAFHLSARMCPAHRHSRIKTIRDRLMAGLPCRLISTQLIEAGVDLDFPIAFRALGPLDSIIQTAGRCNREGKRDGRCPVIVFRPKDGGRLPSAYKQVMTITESYLSRFEEAQARIHEPGFYAQYFAELYQLIGPGAHKDDPVFVASGELNFPIAAEKCQLIKQGTRAVLVKWGAGAQLAEKLQQSKHLTAAECREAQRYSVNLYLPVFDEARIKGYVYQPAEDWEFWVWNSDYNEDYGLGHLDSEDYLL
jgi:CRISPR-associated endonuclease/helicase Cas3